jgi:hypothetical protein
MGSVRTTPGESGSMPSLTAAQIRSLLTLLADLRSSLVEVMKASPKLYLWWEEEGGKAEYSVCREVLEGRFEAIALRVDRLRTGLHRSFFEHLLPRGPNAFFEAVFAFGGAAVDVLTPESKKGWNDGPIVTFHSPTSTSRNLSNAASHAVALVESWIDLLTPQLDRMEKEHAFGCGVPEERARDPHIGPGGQVRVPDTEALRIARDLPRASQHLIQALYEAFQATSMECARRPTGDELSQRALGKALDTYGKTCLSELVKRELVANPRGRGARAGYYLTPLGVRVAIVLGSREA